MGETVHQRVVRQLRHADAQIHALEFERAGMIDRTIELERRINQAATELSHFKVAAYAKSVIALIDRVRSILRAEE